MSYWIIEDGVCNHQLNIHLVEILEPLVTPSILVDRCMHVAWAWDWRHIFLKRGEATNHACMHALRWLQKEGCGRHGGESLYWRRGKASSHGIGPQSGHFSCRRKPSSCLGDSSRPTQVLLWCRKPDVLSPVHYPIPKDDDEERTREREARKWNLNIINMNPFLHH